VIDPRPTILVRHSDRTLNLNPRFSDPKPGNLQSISFEECVRRYRTKYQKPNRAEKTKASEPAQDKLFFDCFGERTPVRSITREDGIRFEEAGCCRINALIFQPSLERLEIILADEFLHCILPKFLAAT
jgi:hypothetical protein